MQQSSLLVATISTATVQLQHLSKSYEMTALPGAASRTYLEDLLEPPTPSLDWLLVEDSSLITPPPATPSPPAPGQNLTLCLQSAMATQPGHHLQELCCWEGVTTTEAKILLCYYQTMETPPSFLNSNMILLRRAA